MGSIPSFTWQSIFQSLPLLKQGIRWRIGNGTQIDVWTEPWLRDYHNFWVQTTHNAELDGLRVSDLMIPGILEWDVELLEELFVHKMLLKYNVYLCLNPLLQIDKSGTLQIQASIR